MEQLVTGILPKVRPPSALIADAGDGKIYLEWNPCIEEDVLGFHVYRQDGAEYRRITETPVPRSEYVDGNLTNGQAYRYAVTAVTKDAQESPRSNEVTASPRMIADPVVIEGQTVVEVPGHAPIAIADALTVTFANGQTIIFDQKLARVRDWVSANGTHLLYPGAYGNAVDITAMDNWGIPEPQPATMDAPTAPPSLSLNTQDFASAHQDHWSARMQGYTVQDGRITFQYILPLHDGAADWFTCLWVWETWYPADKAISGTSYQGLYRKIAIEMPSYFDAGYSVCLNDGFGVDGSCNGAITYDLQWATPYLDEVHWTNHQDLVAHTYSQQAYGEMAKGIKQRLTERFHPSANALQVNPFLFINFTRGSFLLSARRYHYCINYMQSNYVAYGKDGIWPNFMVDCDKAGERFTVETFEYLFTEETALQPPQLFMDAAMHYRRNLARLYQLNPYLTAMSHGWGELDRQGADRTPWTDLDALVRWGREKAIAAQEGGLDMIGMDHDFWFSSPYTVDPEIRKDANHPINRALAAFIKEFTDRDVQLSYWVRPEFVKTSTANALSERFTTRYYGYALQSVPDAMAIIESRGLTMIREHPEWLRKGRDGRLPNPNVITAYRWTPVCIMSGWYDEILLPTLRTMRELGIDALFQDGGYSSMVGVDYTSGKTQAIMPYYWRWFQDATWLGFSFHGELPMGWGNNTLPTPADVDAANHWCLVHAVMRGNTEAKWFSPRFRHLVHSVYGSAYLALNSGEEHKKIAQFCQEFLQEHGHPDRVLLENLRWDFLDPTGRAAQRGWVWDTVYWEYHDGRRVRYPSYREVLELGEDEEVLLKEEVAALDRGRGNTLPAG